jgi:hypothetical protein
MKRLAVLAFVLTGGACDDPAGPRGGRGEIVLGEPIAVTFGPAVTPAMQAQLAALVTVADSAGPAATRIGVIDSTQSAVVMALNAHGEAVLAAWRLAGRPATLDPAGTALVLARSLLPPALFALPDDTTLAGTIREHANFQPLVDKVAALAASGESYTSSREAVELAAIIVQQIVADLSGPAQGLSRAASPSYRYRTTASATDVPLMLSKFPVRVSQIGPATLKLENGSFASFSVTSTAGQLDVADNQKDLPGREVCLLCLPPKIGIPGTATLSSVPDGDLTVTVAFGQSQRETAAMQFGVDIFGGIMRFAGLHMKGADAGKLLNILSTKIDFLLAATKADGLAAVQVILDGFARHGGELLSQMARAALISGAESKAAELVLKNLLKPIGLIDFGVWMTGRGFYYYEVYSYWSGISESVSMCREGDAFWLACTASVQVVPSAVTMHRNQSAALAANAVDANGSVLPGRSVKSWQSSDRLVADVSASGILTAFKEGTTTITASVGGKSGMATVEVVSSPRIKSTWSMQTANGKSLPTVVNEWSGANPQACPMAAPFYYVITRFILESSVMTLGSPVEVTDAHGQLIAFDYPLTATGKTRRETVCVTSDGEVPLNSETLDGVFYFPAVPSPSTLRASARYASPGIVSFYVLSRGQGQIDQATNVMSFLGETWK